MHVHILMKFDLVLLTVFPLTSLSRIIRYTTIAAIIIKETSIHSQVDEEFFWLAHVFQP
jgi:hypothetical protein